MQSINYYCFETEDQEKDSSTWTGLEHSSPSSAFDIANMGAKIALNVFTILRIIAVGAMLIILNAPDEHWRHGRVGRVCESLEF